ncbi:GPI anchored serine-threonine rich family protein [Patescibacteria group bacterium]|nr:GPI anchored serine-threonine rich family protein [Patescibacteria group bacterium]
MKKYFKYSLLIALAVVLSLSLTGGAPKANAVTAEVQAQINALMQQIQALQQQIRQLQAQQGTTAWCHDFNANLGIGKSGDEVANLIIALQKETLITEHEADFDEQVASVVTAFQEKYRSEVLASYGLKYGTGFVGKSTRAKLNSLYGCGIVPPQPTQPMQNQPPTINAVSGPITLKINEIGTWTVKASDSEQGVLTYSVVWGDELTYGASTLAPKSTTYTQTTTFTHSYSRGGAFSPTFTVTDNQGLSAQTSISVNVGDTIPTSTITVTSPNGGETWTSGTKQTIKWQDNTPTPACPAEKTCMPPPSSYYIKLVATSPQCAGGVTCSYTIAKNVAGLSYSWSVGALDGLDNALASDGSYTIQVCRTETTTCDSSDSYFKIASANISSVNVSLDSSTPAGGDITPGRANVPFAKIRLSAGASDVSVNSIQVGSDTPNASDFVQNIKVVDSTSGSQLGATASILTYNGNYYYQWIDVDNLTIPAYSSKTLAVSADVRASVGSGPSIPIRLGIPGLNFVSPGAKTSGMPVYGNIMTVISSKTPSITVLSPNGGEAWQVGSTQFIRWNVSDLTAKLEVGILSDRGYSTVLSNAITSCFDSKCGTYWTIPSTTIPGNYKVVVYLGTYTNYSAKDESDAAFSIVAVTPANTCPQYAPPVPGWCSDGTIVSGSIDVNGCQSKPTCEDKTYHPADTNRDLRINITEVTAYGYNKGQYIDSATNIWRNGESYRWDSTKLDWVPTANESSIDGSSPNNQYSASMLENIKASLDQIQKLITNWNR